MILASGMVGARDEEDEVTEYRRFVPILSRDWQHKRHVRNDRSSLHFAVPTSHYRGRDVHFHSC